MKTIHLARGLTLPAAELATEVVASLGQRGSGTITRAELAVRTGRSMASSAFPKTIGALARLALIEAPRGGDLTIATSFR